MPEITLEQRVDYVLRKLDQWAENMQANAMHCRDNDARETAGRLELQSTMYRELADMLRGADDRYIGSILAHQGQR